MRRPYWADAGTSLYVGDARQVLAELPAESADCIVTSPPYYGLRDYGPGQLGQEATPEEYSEALCGVFTEARRVLAADGTCWLNLGDCYAANSDGWARGSAFNRRQPLVRPKSRLAVPPKNLLGMPWRVAFALQADGWILRNAVVWHKPNAMPHPVRDRLTNRHEMLFLLVKQRHYWFDLDPIRQPHADPLPPVPEPGSRTGIAPKTSDAAVPPSGKYDGTAASTGGRRYGKAMRANGRRHAAAHPSGKNPGDVWSISTRPLRAAHFAAFPIDLPLRAIAAGCRPGGTVLDPFAGAGTSGIAARQLGRCFVGIDIVADYCDLARRRIVAAAAKGGMPSSGNLPGGPR